MLIKLKGRVLIMIISTNQGLSISKIMPCYYINNNGLEQNIMARNN